MEHRMQWFCDAKYGTFIHWGLYAELGGQWKGKTIPYGTEWIMRNAQIPLAEYRKLAQGFNPVEFDAEDWVKRIRGYGSKYLCFTAKHHDGFAMYDSKVSDYNIMHTPYGRDITAELAAACKKYDLSFCLYYSQMQDWEHPDADGNTWDFKKEDKDFKKYFYEKALPQVTELMTNYGPISIIWFDTPYDMPIELCRELRARVRALQPDCIINGRIGYGLGDYRQMSDNCIPERPYLHPWETPMTLNETWGYSYTDVDWTSAEEVIRKLVNVVGKGGNLLLNIGPDAKGHIPDGSHRILTEVGQWLEKNGESLYGAMPTVEMPYVTPWGGITSKPGHLYLHVFKYPRLPYRIALMNLKLNVDHISLLADGRELKYSQSYEPARNEDRLFVMLPEGQFDDKDTVIDIAYSGDIQVVSLGMLDYMYIE